MAIYEFGGFRFDPERGLSRDQKSIHVPGQVSRAIAVLLAARGAIVSKEALAAQAWTTESPSDESVSRCIYLMRRALKHPDGIEVVETLYARGFRITVPVVEVSPRPAAVASRLGRAVSIAAFEGLLSARELIGRRTRDDLTLALQTLRRVVELDPNYAPAWEQIALCRLMQSVRWYVAPLEAGRDARDAADRALLLDAEAIQARAVRGWLRGIMDGALTDGMQDVEGALRLDPQSWQALTYRAWLHGASGMHAEAIADLRRALQSNPFASGVHVRLAWHLAALGQLDDALVAARAATDVLPTHGLAWAGRALVAAHAGLAAEAVESAANGTRLSARAPSVLAIQAYALAAAGHDDEARATVREVDAVALPGGGRCAPVFLVLAYAALDNEAGALAALQHARRMHCPWFDLIGYDRRVRPLLARLRVGA